MRSKTSCFEKTILKKNVTRFAPVWAGYLLCLLLGLVLLRANNSESDGVYFVNDFSNLINCFGIINFALAFLTAQLLFGDLYTPRLCYTLHAFPLDRGQLYRTNLLSGLLFSLVPTTAAALAAAALLAPTQVPEAAMLAVYWWCVCNLEYLFFFGCGAVCAQLAGNRLGQAALYGLSNLGSLVAFLLVERVYTPLLYGVVTPSRFFKWFAPVYHLSGESCFIDMELTYTPLPDGTRAVSGSYCLGDAWSYLLVVAALGAALLILGGYLCRRRQLEAAGDFLGAKPLEPVVQVCLSLTVGTGAAFVSSGIFANSGAAARLLCLAVGLLAGWFAGRMLLDRTTRVFRPKNWVGLAIVAAAVAVSLGLTKLDVLGIQARIPAPEDIQDASISYGIRMSPEHTELVRQFHSQALEHRVERDFDGIGATAINEDTLYYSTRLTYTLKNGAVMTRDYTVDINTPAGEAANRLLNTVPMVFDNSYFGRDNLTKPRTEEEVLALSQAPLSIRVGGMDVPRDYLTQESVDILLQALLADMAEGHAAQTDFFHPTFPLTNGEREYVSFYVRILLSDTAEDYRVLSYNIYPDSTHSLAALEAVGISAQTLFLQMDESYTKTYY